LHGGPVNMALTGQKEEFVMKRFEGKTVLSTL
jgi:hypothetical protein